MAPATVKVGRGKPIRWANVFFWQMSGIAIGALAPFSALAVAFNIWPHGQWGGLFLVAPIPVVAGAILGGTLGMLIGLEDHRPTFAGERYEDAQSRQKEMT
jgi:hypothetical protein